MNKQIIIKHIIESLTELRKINLQNPNFDRMGKKFFDACYYIGKYEIQLNHQEQIDVGVLIKENIKNLDCCIFNLGCNFDENHAPSALIYRSGIQFIIDNFKKFPCSYSEKETESLNEVLNYFDSTDSIEEFDRALTVWKEMPCAGEDCVDHRIVDLKRPSDVPENHTWWL